MTSDDEDVKLAQFARANEHTITNALHFYAKHMRENAAFAQQGYERGRDDAEVKAVQDASFITNNGFRQTAKLAAESAASAERVAEELANLVLGETDD